jgi:hypothetical protein
MAMRIRKIIYIIALVVMELFAPVDGNSLALQPDSETTQVAGYE